MFLTADLHSGTSHPLPLCRPKEAFLTIGRWV
jgi:hypothetical protein